MKKPFFFTFTILLAFAPLFAFAHGFEYLEFNPDQSNSLKVSDVDTPSQVFFAQNDFLGGVDFWIANPGLAGTATFSLLNDQGTILTSKTVSIPTIAETTNGTRLHVDFNSQLSVLAYGKYSVRITSSAPELKLYYADRIKLVSYNSPPVSPYITGVGMLGSEEQAFSFKYGLYETQETSAPIISNLGWTVVSADTMRVDFNANEPVDYKIEYGLSGQGYTASTDFINDYKFCASGIATCNISISVSPNTTYQYRLTAKDSWGNQSQVTGTFSSGQGQTPSPTTSITPRPTATVSASPTPNSNPAVISNVKVTSITDKSADISWTTSQPANSQIIISREVDFSLIISSVFDSTFELEHLLNTGNTLGPEIKYLARIKSSDSSGHESTASISFTTLAHIPSPTPIPTVSGSPPPPPLISSATPTPAPQITTSASPSGDGTSTGTIQWSQASSEPKDGYRVDVFDSKGNFVKTVILPKGSNSAYIPGLKEGDYKVIVYGNNDGVFQKIAQPVTLKIEPSLINRLLGFWPYFLVVLVLIGVLIWLRLRNKTPQITTKVLPS